jgi:hypothetical protein
METLKYCIISLLLALIFVGGCLYAADKEMERREMSYEHK